MTITAKNIGRIDVWPSTTNALDADTSESKVLQRMTIWPSGAQARANASLSVGGGGGDEATAYARFALGEYYFGGASHTLGQMWEENADWNNYDESTVVNGVGLNAAGESPNANPCLTATALGTYAPADDGMTIVVTFTLSGVSGVQLDLFDAPDYNEEWYVSLSKADPSTITSQPSANTQQVAASLADGTHKAALTFAADRFSACIDGGSVITITADLPSPSVANVLALSVNGAATVTVIDFYAPQLDAALPALST